MKKTSLYLTDVDIERIKRLAEREGLTQTAVVRIAIARYEAQSPPNRRFSLTASGAGDGRSIADLPEDELLEGFGADTDN